MTTQFKTEIRQISFDQCGRLEVEDAQGFQTAIDVEHEIRNGWFDHPTLNGGQFFDIGANIGLVSMYVAKINPDMEVIAVEPNIYNYRMMVRNIVRNGLTNIVPLNFAISGWDGHDYKLSIHPSQTGGSTHWTDMVGDQYIVTSSSAITINRFFDRYRDFSRSYLSIKIDVEGEEHSIFDGDVESEFKQANALHLDTHMNESLRREWYSHDRTLERARSVIRSICRFTHYSIEKGA